MRKYIFFILLFINYSTKAQNKKLNGIVKDDQNNLLQGALIKELGRHL